jgi:pimeloyl-ACP methyl ester carboxylesterase
MTSAPQRRPEPRTLITADGVRVSAVHLAPVRPPADGGGLAFVLAHGFTGSWRSAGMRRVAAELVARAGVVAFDFRGHGRSGGASTFGDREVTDLDTAVGWARLLGYQPVVTLGFSMGASVVVRHAALVGGVDAAVAVSGPSRWYYRGTPAMRRVHLVVEHPAGRWLAKVAMRTRIDSTGWQPVPAEPRAVAGDIAPTPLLVVHGDADRFFPLEHAFELVDAAGPSAQLWVERGFGHAEAAVTAEQVRRIAAWSRAAAVVAEPVA